MDAAPPASAPTGALAPACWTPAALLAALDARGAADAVVTIAGATAHATSAAALAEAARRLARALVGRGLAPATPVALYGHADPAWIVARLGMGAAGLLPVAIDDLFTEAEALAVLRHTGCRLVFTSAAHAAHLAVDGVESLVPVDGAWDLPDHPHAALPETPPGADAMLVTTSGTTGAPKVFALTHDNLHANVAGILAYGLLGPAHRVLLPLPPHHVYPFLVGIMAPLAAGAAVVFPEGVTGPQLVQALKSGRVTAMIGVPRLYTALLEGLLGRVASRGAFARRAFRAMLGLSLKLRQRHISVGRRLFAGLHRQFGPDLTMMVSGGARLDTDSSWRIEALGWRLLNGYGLAETASLFTGNVPGRQRIGSEGQPIAAGSRIRVVDPETLAERNTGEQGEIQLSGANVFAGYLGNPDANATAFTPDGWFRTGDLGHLDTDGFLHVTGRLKELIVLGGGKNVFPEVLEAAYGAAPVVAEIAVLERNGALVAIVLPDLEAVRAAGGGVDDVVRVALAERGQDLPAYERLAGFVLAREKLPRTRLSKFQRFRLPALYDALKSRTAQAEATPLSAADEALIARPGARETWAILTARFPDRTPGLDAHPQLDLGLDSLAWVSLAVAIEERTGVRLTDADIAGFASVRAILERVAAGGTGEAAPAIDAAAVAHWTRPPAAALTPLRQATFLAARGAAKLMFSLRVRGAEHLPADGPFIVVANHVSDLDPALIAAAMPLARSRRVWWGGDRGRLFGGPLRRRASQVFQVFPVDERTPATTIAMARAVLERGDGLVWFPESWRSPDGQLQRFLPGVGLMLEGFSDVPVVPTLIAGAFEAMPRNRRLPRRHPVSVTFGPPVLPKNLPLTPTGRAEALRAAVAMLAGPSAPRP